MTTRKWTSLRWPVVVGLVTMLAGCAGISGSTRRPQPEDPLTREQVASDVLVLRQALKEAWAERDLKTKGDWWRFQRDLELIEQVDHTRGSFGAHLGAALSWFKSPALTVVPWDAALKGPGAAADGVFYPGDHAGRNLAVGKQLAWSLFVEQDSSVAVLGIRRFEDADGPAWKGFDQAVEALGQAKGIIIDLRLAEGTDPRGALPLVAKLAGQPDLRPLREIVIEKGELAQSLRAARGDHGFRDPEPWRGLVGEEASLDLAEPGKHGRLTHLRGFDEPPITVILDGGCRSACELTARMLQTYAGAKLQGWASSVGRLPCGHAGKLTLPASGVEVHVPTSAWILNPRIERAGRQVAGWYRSNRGDPYAKPYDGLGRALDELRKLLAWRARERRWISEPPRPCAEFQAYEDRSDLPPAARSRVHGIAFGGHPELITLVIHLPPDRAAAYINTCPGLKADPREGLAFDEQARSTRTRVVSENFAALSRLAQSEVVAHIKIESDMECPPNEAD